MEKLNQLVMTSDKYAVVVCVLFIILIGISITLFQISKKINKI